ncbi:MAG: hypothetical protein IJ877_01515 [Candidatus Gastranaerophilales bacterium]|nr:hypothetical protein [Candidatus Gastranaerophilales bacterium]
MEALSFRNNYYQNNSPDVQKRLESEENFTSIDKEKLKQDTVELANKTKNDAKDNFITKTFKGLGIENPKRFFISLGLTIATVVGLGFLANKTSNKMAELGQKVDDVLLNSKLYTGVSGFFKGIKDRVVNFLRKSDTIDDVFDTLQSPVRKAKVECDMTRGYGQGFVSIFSLTPVDILKTTFTHAQQGSTQAVKTAINGQKTGVLGFIKKIFTGSQTNKIKALLLEDRQKAFEALKNLHIEDDVANKLLDDLTTTNESMLNSIKKLVGEGEAQNYFNQLVGGKGIAHNRTFCSEISNAIAKNHNCMTNGAVDEKKLLKLFKDMQTGSVNGVDFSEFINVKMDQGGIVGSWWPANFINGVWKKITGKELSQRHLMGNYGDSMVKFNVVNGSMAKTLPGKLVQNSILVPGESISNFGNDKSGLGAFLCAMIMSLYNNTQDAPKGTKVATIADDYIGTMGSIAVAMPLAFGTTYGLASLKNLQHKGVASSILRGIGNIFGMGLSHYDSATKTMVKSGNPAARLIGGALRFALIMVILSPKIQKPIRGAIHKIFGKPYDKAEAEKEKQLEEQKNTVIPELGITQGELQERIMKNPKALENLQTNPELIQAIDKNPKLILDLLDGKEVNPQDTLKNRKVILKAPCFKI